MKLTSAFWPRQTVAYWPLYNVLGKVQRLTLIRLKGKRKPIVVAYLASDTLQHDVVQVLVIKQKGKKGYWGWRMLPHTSIGLYRDVLYKLIRTKRRHFRSGFLMADSKVGNGKPLGRESRLLSQKRNIYKPEVVHIIDVKLKRSKVS